MTAATANLIDHLQEQGYDPQDASRGEEWYDLTASGTGTIRVCIDPGDEYRIDVHFFDKFMACEWSATFSPGAPHAAVLAVIEAGEFQLAYRRGGPVTPAQASTR